MLQTTPIPFTDFSGGITENFIDAPINKYETADNFLITENKKLFTRFGLSLYNLAYPQVPVGAQRIGSLITINDDLLVQSGKKLYYDSGTALETVGDLFTEGTTANFISTSSFHETLFAASDNYGPISKVFKDGSGDYQILTAGLPALTNTPDLTTVAGANNYIYAFHYYYEYNVGDTLHIDAGPVTQVQGLLIDSPDSSNITINNIPVLVNASDEMYDTVNIKVKILRTAANETTLYLVDTVFNGTTSYVDIKADADILNEVTIYTTGGVLDNDSPPKAKYVHVSESVMWYGNFKTDTSTYTNRILQSVVNDPDSVPAANFLEFPQEVTGISSYMDRTLIFCKNSVYRVEGNYDEFGTGGPQEQLISDNIGCISNNSIVQTAEGVIFASKNGFAYTDGFQCFLISHDFKETYKTLTTTDIQKKRITGTYDTSTGRVYLSAQTASSGVGENDIIYVCDMRWGISRNMTFTTFSGDNNHATAMAFHGDEILQGDYRGYLLAYREANLSDLRIDVTSDPATWGSDALIYTFKSAAIKPYDTKRFFMPKIIFSAKNRSNLSVQITSDTDTGNRLRNLQPIRWRGNFVWGDPLFTWGQEGFSWGSQGFIEQQRHFHGDDLRGTYKQIGFTNAEVVIIDSDSYSEATTDGTAKTVILDDLSFSWLDDMIGYSISFENDEYSKKYTIISSTVSTLIVSDPDGTLPTTIGLKWQVGGKPKDEILSLLNLVLISASLGQTQEDFTPSQLGGNT